MIAKITTDEKMLADAEQQILDTALQESDQLLARSLHDDERRRKRKRLAWLSVLVIGGVVMSALVVGIMSGWLAISTPVVAEAGKLQEMSVLERVEQAEKLTVEGWKLWQQRNLLAAEEKFSKAVKLNPDATDAWNGLGWSRFNGGQSEKAVEAFGKCVALEPKHPAALNGLGQIYLMWKDYDRAEKYLLLAAPQAPAAHYGLAKVYLLKKQFKKSLPWAEKVAASLPKDKVAEQMLAAAKSGELDEELRKLIEPPGKPKIRSEDAARGWQMFQAGRMGTAERLFRRALEEDEKNLSAINGLAFCLLNQGNHEQAKPLFEQYLSQEKDAAGPMNGLARCLKAEGKVDEAVAIWEQVAEKYPGPSAATSGLARTYLERKEYAKSAKYYKILLDSMPDNKEFQRGLASAEKGLASSKAE